MSSAPMTTVPEELIEQMRAGLEGVTPGPWRAVRDFPDRGDWDGMIVQEMAVQPDGHIRGTPLYNGDYDGFSNADAAHIARCSPENIRILLDRAAISPPIDAGTPASWQYRYKHDNPMAIWGSWGEWNATLASYGDYIEEKRPLFAHPAPIDGRGEAVAWSTPRDGSSKWTYVTPYPSEMEKWQAEGRTVTPLYTHPAQAPGPAMPSREWLRNKIDADPDLETEVRPAPGPADAVSEAERDITAERRRQMEVEGWSVEHDDMHSAGEMARAAGIYALIAGADATDYRNARDGYGLGDYLRAIMDHYWPWDASWFKATTRRRDLVKAGALILAEIERIDRLEAAQRARK